MKTQVELDGNRYVKIGGTWYDRSTFIKPPQVICAELDRLAPLETAGLNRPLSPRDAGRRGQGRAADSRLSAGEFFPIIAKVIRGVYRRRQQYVTHSQIVRGILEDPVGRELVRSTRLRQGNVQAGPAIAGRMIARFSQRMTLHTNRYESQFKRKKIDGKWAYRPLDA